MSDDNESEGGKILTLVPGNTSGLEGMVEAPVESEVSADGLSAEDLKALEEERLLRMESETEAANRLFKEHLVPVAAALVNTAIFGTSPRIKLEAQKIVLDRTLGRVQDQEVEKGKDPFRDLLAACVRQVEDNKENNA